MKMSRIEREFMAKASGIAIRLIGKTIEACMLNEIENIIKYGQQIQSCRMDKFTTFQLDIAQHVERLKLAYENNLMNDDVNILLGVLREGLKKHTHFVVDRRVWNY